MCVELSPFQLLRIVKLLPPALSANNLLKFFLN